MHFVHIVCVFVAARRSTSVGQPPFEPSERRWPSAKCERGISLYVYDRSLSTRRQSPTGYCASVHPPQSPASYLPRGRDCGLPGTPCGRLTGRDGTKCSRRETERNGVGINENLAVCRCPSSSRALAASDPVSGAITAAIPARQHLSAPSGRIAVARVSLFPQPSAPCRRCARAARRTRARRPRRRR
jgi:hypothetical protein